MRILFSHYGLYRKNGWGRTFEFAQGMAELGHDVTIICTSHGLTPLFSVSLEDGVKILKFGDIITVKLLSSGYGVLSLLSRIVYCMFHKYDICHSDSHRDCGFIPCVVNRFFYHSKVIIDWWDNFAEKVKDAPGKNALTRYLNRRDLKTEITTKRNADGVVVLSHLLYDRAVSNGVEKKKLFVLHGGCDVNHIMTLPSVDLKRKMGISKDAITFGFIGMGDAEYSDIKPFLEALIECKNTHNVKFINFGRPLNKTLSLLPDLSTILVEGGWVDYYQDSSKLSAVDVFVLTKEDNIINNSGWPTKFGDYLACGRPVLMNLYGEIVYFSKQNSPGLILVKNEKERIKETIVDIIHGKYNLKELGDRNRKIAIANSWAAKSQELENFYLKLSK